MVRLKPQPFDNLTQLVLCRCWIAWGSVPTPMALQIAGAKGSSNSALTLSSEICLIGRSRSTKRQFYSLPPRTEDLDGYHGQWSQMPLGDKKKKKKIETFSVSGPRRNMINLASVWRVKRTFSLTVLLSFLCFFPAMISSEAMPERKEPIFWSLYTWELKNLCYLQIVRCQKWNNTALIV